MNSAAAASFRAAAELPDRDDSPPPARQFRCRVHNTIFEDGDVCDLCEAGWEPYDPIDERRVREMVEG